MASTGIHLRVSSASSRSAWSAASTSSSVAFIVCHTMSYHALQEAEPLRGGMRGLAAGVMAVLGLLVTNYGVNAREEDPLISGVLCFVGLAILGACVVLAVDAPRIVSRAALCFTCICVAAAAAQMARRDPGAPHGPAIAFFGSVLAGALVEMVV